VSHVNSKRETLGSKVAKSYLILILLTLGLLTPVILTQSAKYYSEELRRALESQAVLIADSASRVISQAPTGDVDLQRHVLSLAKGIHARITMISESGRVIADSQVSAVGLENHAGRPEVREALQGRIGFSKRWSSSVGVSLCQLSAQGQDT
jgi:two-component system phosphate regulon sensor histidine kinase PhoR